jgi:hypothetical protein
MLNKCQEKALDALLEFCYSQEKYICLSGMPGTGKTYLLNEFASQLPSINTVLNIAGRSPFVSIEFTATTNKAATVLKESLDSNYATTIYRLFNIKVTNDYKTGAEKLDFTRAITITDSIIVIDEASMLSYDVLDYINKYAIRCKVIFVGDKNQLPTVGGNGADVFNKFKVIELTKIMRQKPDLAKAIKNAKNALEAGEMIDLPSMESESIIRLNKSEFLDSIVNMGLNDRILCYTNNKCIAYNSHIRNELGLPTTPIKGDMCVSKGRVVSQSADRQVVLNAEESFSIIDVNPIDKYIYIGNDKYGAVEYLTYKGKFIGLRNPELYPLILKSAYANCKQLKDYTNYIWLKENMLDPRFYYSSTIHSAQGSTYDNVYIDLNDILKGRGATKETKNKLLYVAISRAKNKIYFTE